MKTKKLSYSIICLLVSGYMMSCTTSTGTWPNAKSTRTLPNTMGNAGDVLVVMRNNLWKDACGDSIRRYLEEPVWSFPVPEPMFNVSHQSELFKVIQKFRNILIVNVDPGIEGGKLGYRTDVYARNQAIFNIDAPSADSAVACMYRSKDLITARFLLKDREAMIEDYKKIEDKLITEKLRTKFQVDICIPRPFKMDVEKENFVWMAREENEKIRGILMWKEPYLRKTQLEPDSLIFKMNAMTREYVTGSVTGSYMADEPMFPPVVKRFEKDGIYSVQLNGLWQMENGFMGGPYVNQTIVDMKRGQLVTALGFVFYPNREKRLMVQQLEAILYTMIPSEVFTN